MLKEYSLSVVDAEGLVHAVQPYSVYLNKEIWLPKCRRHKSIKDCVIVGAETPEPVSCLECLADA